MTAEIVFYTNPMSRGRTVRWMLEELGVPYRTEVLDVFCGSHLGMSLHFGAIESRPSFEKHCERVSDRPAYRRATELDDALMPKQA